jgi:hypothetical protein
VPKGEKEFSNEDSMRLIQALYGEAPRHLVIFPNKCGGHAGRVVGHMTHVWCHVLQYGVCHSEWIICVACSSGHGSHLQMGKSIIYAQVACHGIQCAKIKPQSTPTCTQKNSDHAPRHEWFWISALWSCF